MAYVHLSGRHIDERVTATLLEVEAAARRMLCGAPPPSSHHECLRLRPVDLRPDALRRPPGALGRRAGRPRPHRRLPPLPADHRARASRVAALRPRPRRARPRPRLEDRADHRLGRLRRAHAPARPAVLRVERGRLGGLRRARRTVRAAQALARLRALGRVPLLRLPGLRRLRPRDGLHDADRRARLRRGRRGGSRRARRGAPGGGGLPSRQAGLPPARRLAAAARGGLARHRGRARRARRRGLRRGEPLRGRPPRRLPGLARARARRDHASRGPHPEPLAPGREDGRRA